MKSPGWGCDCLPARWDRPHGVQKQGQGRGGQSGHREGIREQGSVESTPTLTAYRTLWVRGKSFPHMKLFMLCVCHQSPTHYFLSAWSYLQGDIRELLVNLIHTSRVQCGWTGRSTKLWEDILTVTLTLTLSLDTDTSVVFMNLQEIFVHILDLSETKKVWEFAESFKRKYKSLNVLVRDMRLLIEQNYDNIHFSHCFTETV